MVRQVSAAPWGWLALGIAWAWWWEAKVAHPFFDERVHDFPPLPPAHVHESRWVQRTAWHIDPLMRARLERTHG